MIALTASQAESISEQQDTQAWQNTQLQDLLQKSKAKIRKLSELFKTQQYRLAKLNKMLDQLRRGENVKHRRLATWLTEDKCESFESDGESQQHQ